MTELEQRVAERMEGSDGKPVAVQIVESRPGVVIAYAEMPGDQAERQGVFQVNELLGK